MHLFNGLYSLSLEITEMMAVAQLQGIAANICAACLRGPNSTPPYSSDLVNTERRNHV